MRSLTIATRKSPLALTQTNWVKKSLETLYPDLQVHVKTFVTQGDRFLDRALQTIGGKGLFTKELESALLHHEADLAVHSAKDMPYVSPEGLAFAAISVRENPEDAWVLPKNRPLTPVLEDSAVRWPFLPREARIGTVSLRRQMQIKAMRPDLVVLPLRGNLNRRLERLDAGEFEAIILAAAGLNRMGWFDRISATVEILPAAGQGALVLQCRAGDESTQALLQALHHPQTAEAVWAERAFCRHLGGSCLLPIGAYAVRTAESLRLSATLGLPDGTCQISHHLVRLSRDLFSQKEAELFGQELADIFLQHGADEVLKACQTDH